MIGIIDKIKAGDRLNVNLKPAGKVFCASCGEHIYYLRREIVKGEQDCSGCFAPIEGMPAPVPGDPILCPKCQKPFYAVQNDEIKIKTNKGYLP